jgi:hypothetical protein
LEHLKRHHEEVYYHSNGSDTDFVVKEGMRITKRIQVWYEDVSETAIPGSRNWPVSKYRWQGMKQQKRYW